jgi:long-chain acyl-CoA synthetase
MSERTVYSLLEEAAGKYGESPALYEPVQRDGKRGYRAHSWIEYKRAVEEIALGLSEMGVEPGDVVAIDADTRFEFYLADLGVMTAGAVSAALYVSYPAVERAKTIRQCDAKVAFVDKPSSLRELLSAADPPLDVRWILLTGEHEDVMTLERLRAVGRKVLAEDPEAAGTLRQRVRPRDYAILYLTSGATGEPKMGLVRHDALVANVDLGTAAVPIGPQHRSIAFLPSAHITQRLAMELFPIRMGMPVWFSEGLSRLPHELKIVKPTFFVAPPRVWERLYTTITTEVKKRSALEQRIFHFALGVGSEVVRRRQAGQPAPKWLDQAWKLADRIVFRKIRQRLGGELRIAISGAAPLGKNLADFFAAIGLTIYEGYGLTEGGIVTLNPMDGCRSGSIGKALPGVEVKILADGELVFRSPTLFAGYFKDPEATSAVLRDGWLHTGDLAYMDSEGYIYITGRKKEVLVASNGKKIYPAQIEGLFKMEPLINQVLLVGDKQPYVGALFTLNWAVVETLPGMEAWQGKSNAEMLAAPPLVDELKRIVARVNKQLAPFEQIRKYHVLERDFSIEAGELTPTMKVRRGRVLENHKKLIESMYPERDVAV